MANSYIKPQAADTIGLTAMYSRIGTDCKNAVIAIVKESLRYDGSQDTIYFEANYMWNNAARLLWLGDPLNNRPIRIDSYDLKGIDLNKPLIDQCLDYLTTLPQFDGSQPGSLVWVKS